MRSRTFLAKLFRQLFSLVLSYAVLRGAFVAAAQTRRRPPTGRAPATQTTAGRPPAKCDGGWSGTVTFTKTLDEGGSSDDPGRNPKDRTIQQWTHEVEYNGRMIVDGGGQFPVAFGKVSYRDVRRQHGIQKQWGQCGAWSPEHYFITDAKTDEAEQGGGSGKGDFSILVDEAGGTYSFAFSFPEVPGEQTLDSHTTRTGFCQPQNNLPSDESDKNTTSIRGERGKVSNQKLDPRSPNVLSGSVTLDPNVGQSPKAVKEPLTTISWNLRRCSPPLVIADLKFYQRVYPSPTTWVDIGDGGHTVDGNDVKVVATIVNLSGERRSAAVNFKDLTGNKDLPEGNVTADFAPHEEKQVEYVWDTSGYAWQESAPHNYAVNTRNIQVTIPEDRRAAQIAVHPKPVVIIPGVWSKPEKIARLAGYFNDQNVPWAHVVAPVYVARKADDNAPVIDKTVRLLQQKENAWHVDLVAHSTGGLAARAYVNSLMPTQYDNRPTAAHLVMLGTPNLGTPCASGVENLVTKIVDRNPEAFAEISHTNIRAFNERVTKRRGTKFMAVVTNTISPTCQLDEGGDGVVPYISAIYTSKTYVITNVPHEDLGGDEGVFVQLRKWLALPPSADFAPDVSAATGGPGK